MGKVLKHFWKVECNFLLLMSPGFVTENNKMTTKLDLIKHINQLVQFPDILNIYTHVNVHSYH